MDERRYLIEVLLKARDNISQVTQKAANSLNDLNKAQDKSTLSTNKATDAARQKVATLEKLVEGHVKEKKALEDSSKSLREHATAQRDAATAGRKRLEELKKQAALEKATATQREKQDIEEVRRIRLEVAERVASDEKKTKSFNAETKQLRQQAALLDALNKENAAANRRREADLGLQIAQIQQGVTEQNRAAQAAEGAARKQETAYNRASKAVETHTKSLDRAREALNKIEPSTTNVERSTSRLGRAMERMATSASNTRSSLRGLNAEFQGFQIALVIKYAQSLISALIALGAQFVAVTAAAGQAAIGIGAALAAGAAQAVPVVGLLAASLSRLTAILKIVKLQNQQQLTATHNAERAAKAQRTATDQIRTAEEQVADAHRNTARAVEDLTQTRQDAARQEIDAQRAVNQARKEAVRTVQDLMAAEEDASQSLLRAQLSREQAIQTGDVLGTVSADIDVARARTQLGRARQDAAPARARGVEGIQAVQDAEQRLADTRRQGARTIAQAEQRLADARRSEVRSTENLSRTRQEAKDNVQQETAAVDKLTDSIKQLSPAERTLYTRILALQNTYKRIARPITDIITSAFTDVVNRVNSLLQDPRIARGFRNIAVQVARSIRQVTGEAGGERSVGAFQILSAEAARNIPQATRILLSFFRTVRNLVIDAIPAFRLLLNYVEDYAKRAEGASRNSKGISEFFRTGVRYAKAFFDLGLAVVNLLLTIAGRGGAAGEGIRTINDLTDAIDGLTRKARRNAGAIREFFANTHDALFEILGVLGNIAIVMAQSFSADSVKSFADFLNRVIIPALGNVVKIMGAMVTVFHQVFSLPGVAQVAQMAATMLLLARGLTVIQSAFRSIGQIIPNFLKSMGLAKEAVVGVTETGEAITATSLTTFGVWGVAILAVVAALVLLDRKFHFLGPTFRWLKGAAEDAFGFMKKAAKDTIDWFSDVWTQGLLYWIRWPFVWLAKHAGAPAFHWVIEAAENVIGWFKEHFGPGGQFAIIGDLISLPFRVARSQIHIAFIVIRTIIEGALDLIAGRFDDFGDVMHDFWSDFVDVGRGAITSLLGVIGDLLGALGSIPKIGGPFKSAAKDIKDAQHSIDEMREADKREREERKKANETVKDSLPNLVALRKSYEEAKDRLDKLTPGTKEYRTQTRLAKEASKDYNTALQDTADKAGSARVPVGRLRSNIRNLGNVSADTADVVARNLNDVLSQVGARVIRLNTRAYRKSGIDEMTDVLGHGATGGHLARSQGIRRRLWGGGISNPYGSSADDHVLFSPSGMPVAALSGTEGIVNTPQMGIIDSALGFAKGMGAMPWGSLNELWGSGMRHYAAGGGLQPAIRSLSTRLDKMFGLTTTSTTGGGHAANSYHYQGLAADVSGTPLAMARASRYIQNSGIWRNLLEGIHNPGLSVKFGKHVPSSYWGASTWADHMDHIHLAIGKAVNAIGMISDRIRTPRITGVGSDALSRIALGGARTMTRAANRYIQRAMARLGGADIKAMGADANVVSAFRRAIRSSGATSKERLGLWEAGIVESGLKNLTYGDADSLGALQERASIYGRAHALNPYASALRFLRDAARLRPWRGSAGMLAAAVQRPAAQFRGRYDQVRPQAMRYMQGGGVLTRRQNRPLASPLSPRTVISPVLDQINDLVYDVAVALQNVTRGALRRTKNLTDRIQKTFARLTGDGGILDQMRDAVDKVSARAALRLQQMQFRVTRDGPRRTSLSDAEIARQQLEGLQTQRGGLRDERDVIQDSLGSAQNALREARRRHNRRAQRAAQAAINNLQQRLQANSEALAQNAQDQVEAQESFQQALLDSVNTTADRNNAAIDRWSRVATALGRKIDPNVIIGAQIQNMQQQIGGLQQVLEQARRTGNTNLANQVSDQIGELQTQIAEAVAQQFQNSIDAVNDRATRANARLDRQTRLAQLGGRTDFRAMGSILQQRGKVLQTQRSGLLGLLAQAQAAGNVDQVTNLTDQIDELNTQIAENSQAVKDNTDAAFNFTTELINSTADFQQGVFSGAQNFFKTFSERTGIDTTGQQRTALQGQGASLAQQQQGLLGQLIKLGGLPADIANLKGGDLVNYLTSISSGPAFQAIMAKLDPTQQQAFKDLITALIGNATAIEENTGALKDLTNPGAQSFASTLWTTFRQAIFTGAGGLLPQYSTAIPTAAIGAKVLASGMMVVHAGENVKPAVVSRDYDNAGGDVYNLQLTTPVEVLNPTDIGRQIAFYRKTQRRG